MQIVEDNYVQALDFIISGNNITLPSGYAFNKDRTKIVKDGNAVAIKRGDIWFTNDGYELSATLNLNFKTLQLGSGNTLQFTGLGKVTGSGSIVLH